MSHYAIVGPGALGLLWAARLAPRHQVCLWGRQGSQAHRYELIAAGEPPQPRVIAPCPEPTPDLVLVTTKSYDALSALQAAMPRWRRPPRAIVLLQNGIQSQQEIAAAFGATTHVLAASTTEGANRRPDGSVVHAGRGQTLVGVLENQRDDRIGNANACADACIDSLCADFIAAGFASRKVDNIGEALWQKLLVNAGINAFTVLLDGANGTLAGHPLFEAKMGDLCEELAEVSASQGHDLSARAIETRIRMVIRDTAANLSSMLQDVRAQRRTEIDYINGSLVTLGQQAGLAMPVNQMLWEQVKARELHAARGPTGLRLDS